MTTFITRTWSIGSAEVRQIDNQVIAPSKALVKLLKDTRADWANIERMDDGSGLAIADLYSEAEAYLVLRAARRLFPKKVG